RRRGAAGTGHRPVQFGGDPGGDLLDAAGEGLALALLAPGVLHAEHLDQRAGQPGPAGVEARRAAGVREADQAHPRAGGGGRAPEPAALPPFSGSRGHAADTSSGSGRPRRRPVTESGECLESGEKWLCERDSDFVIERCDLSKAYLKLSARGRHPRRPTKPSANAAWRRTRRRTAPDGAQGGSQNVQNAPQPGLPDWKSAGEYGDNVYETAEGIAKITVNWPVVHTAFRPQTLFELQEAFNAARDDSEVGVVIFTGAGDRVFCSGGDQKIRGEDGYLCDDAVARQGIG